MSSETERLDARLSNVEGTVEQMDQRLGRIEGQLDRLDEKIDGVNGRIDDRIDQVQRRMIRVGLLVAAAITAILAIVQVVVAIAL